MNPSSNHVNPDEDPTSQQNPSSLTPERKREWNRGPLRDLFPRIPDISLEALLDKCADKAFYYQLSQSKTWNARRLNTIAVAHVRHFYTEYDSLLNDKTPRYEARRSTGPSVWKVLRNWCPWDADNDVLRRCFEVTLLPPSERDPTWDPMDIDDESEEEVVTAPDDPMDLD